MMKILNKNEKIKKQIRGKKKKKNRIWKNKI